MRKFFCACLAGIMLLLILISCGTGTDGTGGDQTQNAGGNGDAAEETALKTYEYPAADFGGDDFVVLNAENIWDFLMVIDYEEMSGDSLEDAIYTRNRNMEERYNFKLVQVNRGIDTLATVAQTSILAGDNEFQAAYIGGHTVATLVGSDYLYNLYDIPELRIDEYWWDKSVIDEGRIGNNDLIYFAASDLHLSGMDGTWCIVFNEDMAADLNVDKPYDLVREGKWTFDRLHEYTKAGTNLNGDDSFAWKDSGNSIYGFSSFEAASAALVFASGERMIKRDSSGNPYFALETERFYSVAEKIASIQGTSGEYYSANNNPPNRYDYIFMNGRAFFIGCEIKQTPTFRNVDFTFGLVPFPKYSEDQDNYSSMMFDQALLLTIPITNPDTERAGIIIDALSYESKQNVMPIYYDVYISQKGLRNVDSIEMLGIINESRFFNVGNAYGWTLNLNNSIRLALNSGNSEIASLIAAEKSNIETNIANTMEKIMK